MGDAIKIIDKLFTFFVLSSEQSLAVEQSQ